MMDTEEVSAHNTVNMEKMDSEAESQTLIGDTSVLQEENNMDDTINNNSTDTHDSDGDNDEDDGYFCDGGHL